MDINELMKKDFYIVDCKNFIYYPRIVHIIGFEISYNSEIEFTIDIINDFDNEYKKMYIKELEQFKTFEEAKKYAEKLNNIPENKKRAKEWNSPEEIFRRMCLPKTLEFTNE